MQRLGCVAKISPPDPGQHRREEPEHPPRHHLELVIDPRAVPLGRKEEAVTARERLELRNDPHASVALELLELLDHVAEPSQLPPKPRTFTDLSRVESSRRLDRRIPRRVVTGGDHRREDFVDRPVDDLCTRDQSHLARRRCIEGDPTLTIAAAGAPATRTAAVTGGETAGAT